MSTKYPQSPRGAHQSHFGRIEPDQLLTWLRSAMENSYSPYSGQKVGALIRTTEGDIAVGSEVENAAYTGITASDVAIGNLVSRQSWQEAKFMRTGEERKPGDLNPAQQIAEIMIMTDGDDLLPYNSWGRSLSRLHALAHEDAVIYLAKPDGIKDTYRFNEILTLSPPKIDTTNFAKSMLDFWQHHQTLVTPQPDDSRLVWTRQAQRFAYAPYSNYRVGAMLRAQSGEIFTGCNVESSYGDALHAEDVAIGNMIASLGLDKDGHPPRIAEMLIMGGMAGDDAICTPCGKCRQMINEFATDDTLINAAVPDRINLRSTQGKLLPYSFGQQNLKKNK